MVYISEPVRYPCMICWSLCNARVIYLVARSILRKRGQELDLLLSVQYVCKNRIESLFKVLLNNDCSRIFILVMLKAYTLICLSHALWLYFLLKPSTFCLQTYNVHLLINIKHCQNQSIYHNTGSQRNDKNTLSIQNIDMHGKVWTLEKTNQVNCRKRDK